MSINSRCGAFAPQRRGRATQARIVAAVGLSMSLSFASAAAPPTAEDYKKNVPVCMRARDLECAQKSWTLYLQLRPTDSNAIANLAIVMNMRGNDAAAVTQFEQAIDLGEGTYDLFAYYADSLTKVGRIDEAIDWSYKSLAVYPKLVDVRGKLAKLLVLRKRHYEALSLLSAYDGEMATLGQTSYFEGQRIAIESALARSGAVAGPETGSLRLPKYGDHFYAPVTLGDSRPAAFVVDTGASRFTLSDDVLAKSKADYKVLKANVVMQTANGQHVNGRMLSIKTLRLGSHELHDVSAFVCKQCISLLGQSALSMFDLKSSKVQGVEFLTLTPRR